MRPFCVTYFCSTTAWTPESTSTRTRLYVHGLLCSIIPGEIMALTIGTQLGSHEITALLGKGGMDI